MVPLVTKQAVKKKVTFPKAKLTGNYECAYAAGMLCNILGIDSVKEVESLSKVYDIIASKASGFKSDDEKVNKLLELFLDYEPKDILDEQMIELFNDGVKSVDL